MKKTWRLLPIVLLVGLLPLQGNAAEILFEDGNARVVTGDWAARVSRGIAVEPAPVDASPEVLQEAAKVSAPVADALVAGLKRHGWAQLEHEPVGSDALGRVRVYAPQGDLNRSVLDRTLYTGQVVERVEISENIERQQFEPVPTLDRSVYHSLESVEVFVSNQEHFQKQFFEEMIDLDYPGLEPVRAAYEAQKHTLAIFELAEYFRRKKEPADLIPKACPPPGSATSAVADQVVDHVFSGQGIPIEYGEHIEWSRQREGVVEEFLWGLNGCYQFHTLVQAYLTTGNEKYAKEFSAQIIDWIIQNPAPPYTLTRVATWRNLEAGTRAARTWPPAFYGFLCSPNFEPQTILLVLGSLWSHGNYIYEHPAGLRRPSNWSVIDSTGLAGVASYFPEFRDSAKWREEAYERLAHQLSLQVYPDGAQWELAPGYHLFCLDRFDLAFQLAQQTSQEVPEGFGNRLESMYEYIMWLIKPDGTAPAFSDSHPGLSLRGILKQGANRFDRKDMLYVATNGKEGTPPDHRSHHHRWAGYSIMRSGWDSDALYLAFDGGPVGTGHQHDDMLSFVLSAYGRHFIIDPGPHIYTNDKWRLYAVSTFAHSTVLVDGLCQIRVATHQEFEAPEDPETVWETNDRFDYTQATYKAGYRMQVPDSQHRRHVFFAKPEYWVIVDEMLGEGTHSTESLFHFAPDLSLSLGENGFVQTNLSEGPNLAIVPNPTPGLEVEIIEGQEEPHLQGWFVPGGEDPKPAPVVCYELTAPFPRAQAYALMPIGSGNPPSVEVGLDTSKEGFLDVSVRWSDNERRDRIRLPREGTGASLERSGE